jgi:hypothetical protein
MFDPRLIPAVFASLVLIFLAGLPIVVGTAYSARALAGMLYQFGLR